MSHSGKDDAPPNALGDLNQSRESVMRTLASLEKSYQVKILLAGLVGGRAWGISSASSDCDVRFVFVRHPKWYISIDASKKETISFQVGKEFDYFGWDARKALQLLRESNLSILDLLRTPVQYICDKPFLSGCNSLVDRFLGKRTVVMHYISMAKKHDRDHFGERAKVTLKKYFYVIIPLLSVMDLEQKQKTKSSSELPPMEIESLLSCLGPLLPQEFVACLMNLLHRKRQPVPLGEAERIPALDQWITLQMKAADMFSSSLPLVHLHEIPTDDFSALLYDSSMRHHVKLVE